MSHKPGWRKLARLNKGEEIVGPYANRQKQLNPIVPPNPVDVLQRLFKEHDRLRNKGNKEGFACVEEEI